MASDRVLAHPENHFRQGIRQASRIERDRHQAAGQLTSLAYRFLQKLANPPDLRLQERLVAAEIFAQAMAKEFNGCQPLAEIIVQIRAHPLPFLFAHGQNLLFAFQERGVRSPKKMLGLVIGGKIHVSPRVSESILRNISARKPRGSDSPIQALSNREFEVFQLIGQGKSTREIAARSHLSPKTVDVHRGHIREKLGLKDVTALLRLAVQWLRIVISAYRRVGKPIPPTLSPSSSDNWQLR